MQSGAVSPSGADVAGARRTSACHSGGSARTAAIAWTALASNAGQASGSAVSASRNRRPCCVVARDARRTIARNATISSARAGPSSSEQIADRIRARDATVSGRNQCVGFRKPDQRDVRALPAPRAHALEGRRRIDVRRLHAAQEHAERGDVRDARATAGEERLDRRGPRAHHRIDHEIARPRVRGDQVRGDRRRELSEESEQPDGSRTGARGSTPPGSMPRWARGRSSLARASWHRPRRRADGPRGRDGRRPGGLRDGAPILR